MTCIDQAGRHDAATYVRTSRHRDYSPALGRWLQPDPLGYVDGASLYQYVTSNPVARMDPFGRATIEGVGDPQTTNLANPTVTLPNGGRVTIEVSTGASVRQALAKKADSDMILLVAKRAKGDARANCTDLFWLQFYKYELTDEAGKAVDITMLMDRKRWQYAGARETVGLYVKTGPDHIYVDGTQDTPWYTGIGESEPQQSWMADRPDAPLEYAGQKWAKSRVVFDTYLVAADRTRKPAGFAVLYHVGWDRRASRNADGTEGGQTYRPVSGGPASKLPTPYDVAQLLLGFTESDEKGRPVETPRYVTNYVK
jgi:RHS repeat-associated protein